MATLYHHQQNSQEHAHSTKLRDVYAQDNNGLTRGQYFMEVENLLRRLFLQTKIT